MVERQARVIDLGTEFDELLIDFHTRQLARGRHSIEKRAGHAAGSRTELDDGSSAGKIYRLEKPRDQEPRTRHDRAGRPNVSGEFGHQSAHSKEGSTVLHLLSLAT